MKKILIINGPNINLTGKREPELYGDVNYKDFCVAIEKYASQNGFEIDIFQSNHEGELIDEIQKALEMDVDFIIANLGAYTHTSIALRDALLAVNIPFIEVHLSNVFTRENFRKKSYISDIAVGVISGFGWKSYILAIDAVREILS